MANALHEAHEAGVIHRDLKPSNVLMDLAGEPYLTDFGLAKRESGEITMTMEGRILGTPAYMSPEQARGEAHRADRRSDIYSLGVMLFELLTGELPFRGEERMLIVQILKDEPPLPRKLNYRIPRDLETICLKCLQKKPDARYQSAAELSSDLQRWLEGRPILARPVGRVARLYRWACREPRTATLAATILCVVLLGIAGITWQWRNAVAATIAAQQNLAEKEVQQARRKLNFDRAMAAVDRMLTHVGEQDLSQIPSLAPVRKAILQDALKLYEELSNEASDERVVRIELAQAVQRVASIRWLLYEYDLAFGDYERAIALLEKLRVEEPHNLAHVFDLSTCILSQARIRYQQRRFGEAIACYERENELMRPLAASGNQNAERGLMHGSFKFAEALLEARKYADAERVLRDAIKLGERKLGGDKEDFGYYSHRTAYCYVLLERSLAQNGGDAASRELALRRGVEINEMLAKLNDGLWVFDVPIPHGADPQQWHSFHNVLAMLYGNVATLLRKQNREEEAAAWDQKMRTVRIGAIQRQERQVAQNVKRRTSLLFLGVNATGQARLLRDQKATTEAREYYRKAIDAYRTLAADFPSNRNYTRAANEAALELASVLVDDPAHLQEGLSLLEQLRQTLPPSGTEKPNVNDLDNRLVRGLVTEGLAARDAKDLASAQTDMLEALAIADRMVQRSPLNPDSLDALYWAHQKLGDLLQWDQRRPGEAVSHYEQARNAMERLAAKNGLDDSIANRLGWSCQNGGHALLATKRDSHLVNIAVRGLEMREYRSKLAPDNVATQAGLRDSYVLLNLALAHTPDPAAADVRKAAELARDRTTSDPGNGLAWRALGIALCRQRLFGEAVSALEKSIAAKLDVPAYDRFFMAMARFQANQRPDATMDFEAGDRWFQQHQPNNALLRALRDEAKTVVKAAE